LSFLKEELEKVLKYWLIALLYLPGCPSLGVSQEETPPAEHPDLPKFYFDALVFSGNDSSASRLDLYVQVPFGALQFVKGSNNSYDAVYEETISIFDKDNNLVTEKLSTERVHPLTFTETLDPSRYNLTQRFFTLMPGRYTIAVQVRDEETRKAMRSKREIEVQSMHESDLTISDLMLVSRLRLEGDKKTLVPNVSGNVADLPDGFYIFCEVYNKTDCDTLELAYHVKTAKNEERLHESFAQAAVRGKNQIFVKINSTNLPLGRYTVGLRATACGNVTSKHPLEAFRSHPFIVQWSGLPLVIDNLDAAIDQLTYTAESGELDYIKKATTQEEKKKRFYEFWKKRNPSPNSERNEAMEQYYGRVAVANKNFSHYVEGWKTDRGMVYIMFGPPSNIDRHPFDSDAKPYEVWYYNDLNYRFLFVDQSGFGDYRLDPSTPLWSIQKRKR